MHRAGGLRALLDANASPQNEIHAVAGIAFGENGLTVGIVLLLQGRGETGEGLAVHRLEHGDLFEFLRVHSASRARVSLNLGPLPGGDQGPELLRVVRLAEGVFIGDQPSPVKFGEGLFHRAHAIAGPVWMAE